MKKTEKNKNITQAEEEISRLGYDYKGMLEAVIYVDKSYALLTEGFKLNVNADQHTHDKVNILFGIGCANREPVSLKDMFVRLVRYSGNSCEGTELDWTMYRGNFPTKTQLLSEMKEELKKYDHKTETEISINMKQVEENNNMPVEEAISGLGFEYKSMLEKALYVENKYALLIEEFKLNVNPEQHTHDEVHVQFGINCTEKGKPISINDMSVRLIQYSARCYEGIELDCQFYVKNFPTKDQILTEMKKKSERHEFKNRIEVVENSDDRIAHAKETLSAIAKAEQRRSVRVGKKIK